MWEDKETTAPDPSVAPDGEQPSALARTDSIATFEETNKQFGKMRIFSMPELMDTHFPSRPCIIENLLPAGTYLLAGAPKIGKSFLVLQMAYQVSAGEPFLGFPSRQGTVLYLALEDTYERLQKRLAQMTERDSPDLRCPFWRTRWKKICWSSWKTFCLSTRKRCYRSSLTRSNASGDGCRTTAATPQITIPSPS